jgi:hypothetical protein
MSTLGIILSALFVIALAASFLLQFLAIDHPKIWEMINLTKAERKALEDERKALAKYKERQEEFWKRIESDDISKGSKSFDVTWGDWSESDSSDENKPNDGLTYNR